MESSDTEDAGSCSFWTRIKDKFNPKKTYQHVGAIIKIHGWKIGVIAIVFETAEHFLLPAVLIAVTGSPELVITGAVPVGELIFYPALFRIIGGSV